MSKNGSGEYSPQETINIMNMDPNRIIAQDRDGKWYENSFYDRNDLTVNHVIATLQEKALPLAKYADKYNAFFVITIKEEKGSAAEWTIMPAFDDPRIVKEQTSPKYAEKLKDAWGHIIIGPSGDAFTNSEQVGVMDANLQDGTFAFDVTYDDGISCHSISRIRDKMIAEPGPWKDWSGVEALNYAYEADPGTNRAQVVSVGKIALF